MASPADEQAAANADVERVAAAIYEEVRDHRWPWSGVGEAFKEEWRGRARRLLASGVIRAGPRPDHPAPMDGQMVVEDYL